MEVKRRTVKNQCESCCYTKETHNAAAAAAYYDERRAEGKREHGMGA